MSDLHANAELITSFYDAFARRDYESMGKAYADDATFADPVFLDLSATETRAMWHMLCEQGTDLHVTASAIEAGDDQGSARWDAHYSFGPDKRLVHNSISAQFAFDDGRIVEHRDSFDLWKWTRMALGTMGLVMGWTPFVQDKVRSTARHSLEAFIEAHPEYQD